MILKEMVNKDVFVNTVQQTLAGPEEFHLSFPDKAAITDVRVSGGNILITYIAPSDTQHSNKQFKVTRGPVGFIYQFDLDLIGTDIVVESDGSYEIIHIFMRRR
jgi:hypothetical protein